MDSDESIRWQIHSRGLNQGRLEGHAAFRVRTPIAASAPTCYAQAISIWRSSDDDDGCRTADQGPGFGVVVDEEKLAFYRRGGARRGRGPLPPPHRLLAS